MQLAMRHDIIGIVSILSRGCDVFRVPCNLSGLLRIRSPGRPGALPGSLGNSRNPFLIQLEWISLLDLESWPFEPPVAG